MNAKRSVLFVLSVSAWLAAMSAAGQWVKWGTDAGGNGHWYLPVHVTNLISWATAYTNAQQQGGYLATITSAQEDAFVLSLVKSSAYWSRDIGPALGGYQTNGSSEPAGGWAWVTGEPWAYTHWAGGQPDNGRGGPAESILHYWGSSGTWNDQVNTGPIFLGYVVERDTPPSPPAFIRVSQVEISWQTESDQVYQLEYSTDLTPGVWQPLGGTVLGTGGVYVTYDTVPAGAPRRFYRVVTIQ
jgi:hypothetical protein